MSCWHRCPTHGEREQCHWRVGWQWSILVLCVVCCGLWVVSGILYGNVSRKELFVADAPLVINRAGKTHFICRNLYKTYKTVGFVPGSNFFLTFCTTQDENQSFLYLSLSNILI